MQNVASMSQEDIDFLVSVLCGAGFTQEITFAEKANRDAVYQACVKQGAKLRRWSMRNCVLDPRYTYEGRFLPDLGLGNTTEHYSGLYFLKRIV